MSTAAINVNKKRTAAEAGAAACPASKKTTKDAVVSAQAQIGGIPGVPGWQYPPLPMGMMHPMPFCMPGNPFFNPFMGVGLFPPFWLPAAAMAAATMPAFAAASAANASAAAVAGVPALSGAAPLQAAAAMWPMMAACGATSLPHPVPASAPVNIARSSSGISGDIAFPSTSCTNSVPTAGLQSPASPPPLATSPGSVCNGPQEQGLPPADDEFAIFIDSFLRADDGADLTDAEIKAAFQTDCLTSCGGSNSSDLTVTEDPCLARSESHSLLTLLGEELGL